MRWSVLWAVAALLPGLPVAAADDAPRVETVEPRAYGYQVGDTLRRRLIVHAGDDWRLDPASLPLAGRRGQALELRSVHTRRVGAAGSVHHEIDLEYQVFVAPPEVRTIEIAPWKLRLVSAQHEALLRVEAWPVTVAPLVPLEVSPRHGLGDLQPDIAPPLFATAALRTRLLAYALAAAVLLIGLGTLHFGPPWRAARNRPFGRALRALRRLPAPLSQAQRRAAFRVMHEALNGTAGHALFEHDLEAFVQAHPDFGPLRSEVARFLQVSRCEFFDAQAAPEDHDPAWLVDLARRCHAAERGLR
jgi:mxaA protein